MRRTASRAAANRSGPRPSAANQPAVLVEAPSGPAVRNSGAVTRTSLRTLSRTAARIGVSIAVPQTSPSPWAACPSPRLNNAPGTCTGSHRTDPAVRWRVSMLPPVTSGGIVLRASPAGATPSSPQNGASGMRIPGRNSAATRSRRVIRRYGSGNSSASRPKPGMFAVQPQSPGSKESSSTSSVSPGSAPSTKIGPATWSTWSKASVARSAAVDVAVTWPLEASSASNSTTLPGATTATGGTALSQARCHWLRPTWKAGWEAMA